MSGGAGLQGRQAATLGSWSKASAKAATKMESSPGPRSWPDAAKASRTSRARELKLRLPTQSSRPASGTAGT